jgi:colicin import membrane protein
MKYEELITQLCEVIKESESDAEEIYDKTYAALDTLAHSENQIQSGIAIVNRKQHIIAARYTEWLEFSRSFISVDRTKFNYTIIAKCADGKLHVTLERISYSYDEGRPSAMHTTADKWINDKNAVNKKRTKLLIGPAKFRRKTIDRKDQIFTFIKEALTTK